MKQAGYGAGSRAFTGITETRRRPALMHEAGTKPDSYDRGWSANDKIASQAEHFLIASYDLRREIILNIKKGIMEVLDYLARYPGIPIAVLCLAIILLVYSVWKYVSMSHRETVYEKSRKIPALTELNKRYSFEDLDEAYDVRRSCKSKKEYDNLSFSDILCEDIFDNRAEYDRLISETLKNRNDYYRYENEYRAVMENEQYDNDLYSTIKYFERVERKICDSMKLFPVTELTVYVTKDYISPKGRNYYHDHASFETGEIIGFRHKVRDTVINTIKKQREIQYERSKMSDSLRYDVMKRDGFRCVLCGASRDDGITLHVDHIIPVSRGGKTEMSNLRTLCERCNLGKGAKYDPEGPN